MLPGPLLTTTMALPSAMALLSSFSQSTQAAIAAYPMVRSQTPIVFVFILALQYHGHRGDVYNLLWAVVFGFATLNILSLAAKRLEPRHRGLSFGELMAVLVVILSIVLLGWELLNLFHVFPIKLKR